MLLRAERAVPYVRGVALIAVAIRVRAAPAHGLRQRRIWLGCKRFRAILLLYFGRSAAAYPSLPSVMVTSNSPSRWPCARIIAGDPVSRAPGEPARKIFHLRAPATRRTFLAICWAWPDRRGRRRTGAASISAERRELIGATLPGSEPACQLAISRARQPGRQRCHCCRPHRGCWPAKRFRRCE